MSSTLDPQIQQLLALKTATETVGCIHEAQVLQLKSYPILISGIKQPWTIKVNPDTKTVAYKLIGRRTKETATQMEEVASMIRKFILWDETVVEFYLNKKTQRF